MAGEDSLINAIGSFNTGAPKAAAKAPTEFNLGVKRESLTNVAAEKKAAITGEPQPVQPALTEDEMMSQYVARREGTRASRDGLLADMGRMTNADLRAKYGDDYNRQMLDMSEAIQGFNDISTAERPIMDVLTDTGAGIIGGAGTLASSLAALTELESAATGIKTPQSYLMQGVGKLGRAVTEASEGWKSEGMQDRDRTAQITNEVKQAETKAQQADDIASGSSPMMAGLTRIARDTLGAGDTLLENPALIGDLISENVASLAAGAGVGSVVTKGAVTAQAAARGLTGEAAEQFVRQGTIKASAKLQPVLGAVEEAGGAADQAGQLVDSLTDDEIRNSPVFKDMGPNTSIEDARARIRFNLTATNAAAAAGTAMVAGQLTKTFDAAPLSPGSLAKVPVNMAGEGLEEGIMGLSGGLTENAAVQANVDESQDLVEGVGQQIAEGAIAGAGIAATMGGPGALVSTGAGAVNIANRTGQAVAQAAKTRNENQMNADDITSDANIAPIRAEADAAVEALMTPPAPVVEEGAEPGAEPVPEVAPANPIIETVRKGYTIPDEEVAEINPRVLSIIQDETGNIPRNRVDVINTLDTEFHKEGQTKEDKQFIASEIISNLTALASLNNEEAMEYAGALAADDPIKQQYGAALRYVVTATQKASLRDAAAFLMDNPIEANPITEEMDDRSALDQIQVASATAQANPANLDPKAGQDILDLIGKRNLQVPEDQVRVLRASVDISRTVRLYSDAVRETSDTVTETQRGYNAQEVSNQIVDTGWEGPRGQGKLSITQHATEIMSLVQQGKMEAAKLQMADLDNFTKSQLNKTSAIDKSSKDGKRHNYDAYDPATGKFSPSKVAYGLTRNSKNSYINYEKVFTDTSLAVAVQNAMATQFPELGIQPRVMPNKSMSVARREGIFNRKGMDALSGSVPAAKAPNISAPKNEPVLSKRKERELIKEGGGKKPLSTLIATRYKGIDPKSEVAKELRARGINNKSNPGIFKVGGLKGLDNIVASEEIHLAQTIGQEGDYLSLNGLLEALTNERDGMGVPVTAEQAAALDELEARRDEMDRLSREEVDANEQSDTESQPETPIAPNEPAPLPDTTPIVTPDAEPDGSRENPLGTDDIAKLAAPETPVAKRDLTTEFAATPKVAEYFDVDERSTSIVVGQDSPVRVTQEAVAPLDMPTTAKVMEKIPSLVQKATDNLKKAFAEKIKGNTRDNIATYRNMRPINFADENGVMDSRIVEAAAVAAVNVAMTVRGNPNMDVDDILDINTGDGNISENAASFVRERMPEYQVIQNIARQTMDMLGIKPKSGVSEADSRASFESLASEMLLNLAAEGVFDREGMTIAVTDNNDNVTYRSYAGVKLNPAFISVEESATALQEADKMSRILNPDADPIFNVNTPPKSLRQTQKGTGADLSKLQKDAIRFQSGIEYTPNNNFITVVEALGEKLYNRIRGFVEITKEDEKLYNRNDLDAIKGKNNSIEMEYSDTFNAITVMADLDDGDGPRIYFPHEVTRVGRMQQVGPANPQSNKHARSALRSTKATVDLSDPTNMEGFIRSLVQMTGVGKPENLSPEYLMAEGLNDIENKFGPAIRELESFFTDKEHKIDGNVMERLLSGSDPVVLESLINLAQYNITDEAGRKAFDHTVPLESDGVTNGPAAVLMKFSTGPFRPSEIDQMQRIGFFFSDEPKAMHQKTAAGDTYGVTAKLAEGKIVSTAAKLDTNVTRAHRDAATRFMKAFSPTGVKITQETAEGATKTMWDLVRNAAKNPLTKTTYGAGKMGTARGITKDMIAQMYKAMSDDLKNNTDKTFGDFVDYPGDFKADIKLLTEGYIKEAKDGKLSINPAKMNKFGQIEKPNDLDQYTLSGEAMEALAQNINAIYVDPLYQAVEETMGSSFVTMSQVIRAAQLQSSVMKAAFDQFMSQYGNRDTYSPKEYKAWEDQYKALGAYIEAQDQNFFIGGTKEGVTYYAGKKAGKTIDRQRQLTGSVDNTSVQSGFRQNQPGFAGVSAAAFINIGTGDGYMMTHAHGNPVPGMERTLQVFDGQEMPIDMFKQIGVHMNESAYAAWQSNTMESILDSFESFARNLTMETITQEMAEQVINEVFPYDTPKPSLKDAVAETLAELRRITESVNARTKARAQFSTYTDQMAGANAPYHNKGKSAGSTNQEIADNLNAAMEADKKISTLDKTRMENAELTARLEANADTVAGDVKTITIGRLRTLFPLMSQQSKDFYRDILKDNVPAGLEVFYGPADQMEAYRQANYPVPDGVSYSSLTQVDGQYDPNANVLFLVQDQKGNGIGETLIHEMTHAAIAGKISEYFSNPQAMTPVAREAVQRMVALTNEFLSLNFAKDSDRVKDRIKELRNLRNSNDTADARLVNEVMTTMLTNPDIMKVAKQTRFMNPAGKIIGKAMALIRRALGLKTTPKNDFFSNAYFNAEILAKSNSPAPDGGTKQDVLNKLNPTGARGAATSKAMRSAVDSALAARNLNNASLVQDIKDKVTSKSYLSLIGFEKAGFEFNPEEAKTFEQVMEVFMVGDARLNGSALVRAQEVFDSVISDLTVDDFMEDPALNNPNDRVQAEAKFKEVVGLTTRQKKDMADRSLVLPAFLALAASNTAMADMLAKKFAPARAKFSRETFDDILSSTTQGVIDSLTTFVVGEHKGSNAKEAVDNLLGKLADLEIEKQSALETLQQNTYNAVEEFMVSKTDMAATALSKKLEATHVKLRGTIAAAPLKLTQMAVSLMSKTEGKKSLDTITNALNQKEIPIPLTELFAEIKGRNEDNSRVYDMLNKVRAGVSAIREEFREQYPKLIQNNFSKKLTKGQKTTLHKGIGKTDIAGLMINGMPMQQVARLFSSNPSRAQKITDLSKGLNNDVLGAVDKLAEYMVNDLVSPMLRRNAYAISKLQNGASEQQISDLVSVMAIDKLSSEERKAMSDLFMNESKGMKFSLAQMSYFRRAEYAKTQGNEVVRMNQLQGYIPSEAAAGVSIVLAPASEHRRYAAMGYHVAGQYGGDSADPDSAGMAYYRTNVSSRNGYTQGVAQTVEASQNGVDIKTGRLVNGTSGGVISGAAAKAILRNIGPMGSIAAKGEALMPIFDSKGNIIAFERPIKADMLALKKRDTDFGKMVGAMAGRQEEERQARKFNKELVLAVKERYDLDSVRHNSYVNLAKSKDKIHQDTWKAIPREMKEDLAQAFGEEDFFPVRRDMIPMVVGYRNAGVSDLWSGVSRIPEEHRKVATDMVMAIFGRPAYEKIMQASKIWTTVVSEAKVIIVVKSVVVPAMNLMSNVLQLMTQGVPARTILTRGVKVFTEISKYDENQKEGIRLQAAIRAESDPNEKAKLGARLDSLKAANRRMSIWPLIEAGEYKTISEGLTDADVSIREGKLVQWIEQKVEELPEGVKTLGKYAVVSKTTALYKGLDKATQYGDFIAKAILYDDIINRQGESKEKAHSIITEEFVNYDVPAGRSRTFLEQYGLLMFGNYKIRSLKPAIRNIRDNPLRALMSTMLTQQYSFLGSPISDNIIASASDGRLENAIGPGMVFRAPTLIPAVALLP